MKITTQWPTARQVMSTIIISLLGGGLTVIGILAAKEFGWWFAVKEVTLDYFISVSIITLVGLVLGMGFNAWHRR